MLRVPGVHNTVFLAARAATAEHSSASSAQSRPARPQLRRRCRADRELKMFVQQTSAPNPAARARGEREAFARLRWVFGVKTGPFSLVESTGDEGRRAGRRGG